MDVRSKKPEPFAQSEDQDDELLSIVAIKGYVGSCSHISARSRGNVDLPHGLKNFWLLIISETCCFEQFSPSPLSG